MSTVVFDPVIISFLAELELTEQNRETSWAVAGDTGAVNCASAWPWLA